MAIFCFTRRSQRGLKPMGWMMLAVAIWTVGYAGLIVTTDSALLYAWHLLRGLGIVTVPTFWLLFVLRLSGYTRWLNRQFYWLLAVEPVVTFLLLITNERHGWISRGYLWESALPFAPHRVVQYGPWFVVNLVYDIGLMLAGVLVLLLVQRRRASMPRQYVGMILMGIMIAGVASLLSIMQIRILWMDPMPFGFLLVGIIAVWGVTIYRFFDLSSMAHNMLVTRLEDGVIVLDGGQRVVDVNPAAMRVLGCSAANQCIGRPLQAILPKWNALEPGLMEPAACVEAILGEPGRFFELRVIPLNVAQEKAGKLLVIHDITERKQVEQALRLSSEYNRALIEHSPVGISVRDRLGRLLSYNQAWKQIWAMPDEAIADDMNRERQELVFDRRDSYLGDYLPEVERVYRQGGSAHLPELKTRGVRPGAAEWVSQYFYAIQDANGVVDRVVILTEDITHRKRITDELRESQASYQMLIESLGEGICIVDGDEKFLFANPACEAIFGVSTGQLVGQDIHNFTDDENYAAIRLQTVLRRRGEKSTYQPEIIRPDGQRRRLLVTATPSFTKDKQFIGAFAILTDITDLKQAETRLRWSNERLQRQNDLLAQILAVGDFLRLHQDTSAALTEVVNAARQALGFDVVVLNLLDPQTGKYSVHVFAGLSDEGQRVLAGATYAKDEIERIMRDEFRQGRCYFIPAGCLDWEREFPGPTFDPLEADPHWSKPDAADAWDPQDALFVPIELRQGEIVGLLWVDAPQTGRRPDADTLRALEIFANQVAVAIENARLFSQVQHLAIVDDLTGLYNRRGLFELGNREVERARRFDRPLAALFLDIDHFRDFNNRYSHAVGDQVLRSVVDCCRSSVRVIDLVARYGGEEFIILLLETDLDVACHVAERLRNNVEAMRVKTGCGELGVTISIGVTALTSEIPDLAALLDRANRAEHRAKDAGRNCVSVIT